MRQDGLGRSAAGSCPGFRAARARHRAVMEHDVVTFPPKAFLNDRLTFRLDVLAAEAISANDQIFVDTLDLTIREVRVLRLIDDYPGITFIEICSATGIERTLTSRIVRKLMADGLVSRDNAQDDARRYRLSTTPVGKQRRLEARALSDALEEVLMQPLSAQEIKQLKTMLDRLALWVRSPEYRQAMARSRTSTRLRNKRAKS